MYWMSIVSAIAGTSNVASSSNKWYDGTVEHHLVADAPFVFKGRIESYGTPGVVWYDSNGVAAIPGFNSGFVSAQDDYYRGIGVVPEYFPVEWYSVAIVEVLEVYRGKIDRGERVDVYISTDWEMGSTNVGREGLFFMEPFVDPRLGAYPMREGGLQVLMPVYLNPYSSIVVEADHRSTCPGRAEFQATQNYLMWLRSSPTSIRELALRKGLQVEITDPFKLSVDGRPALQHTLTYDRLIWDILPSGRPTGNSLSARRDGDVLRAEIDDDTVGAIGCDDLPQYSDLLAILRSGQW
jgi:hypothetical protein